MKAFSLIELLMVIALIAILGAFGISKLGAVRSSSLTTICYQNGATLQESFDSWAMKTSMTTDQAATAFASYSSTQILTNIGFTKPSGV